jgi:hypothetical protein
MSIEAKSTYIADSIALLVEQFKDSPNLISLLTSFVAQLQELDTVVLELYTDRWLESAIGAQLDIIGAIVGEERQGKSDDDYRDAIKVRIGINLGNGTAEDVIEVVRSFFDDMTVQIVDYYPASFVVRLIDPIDPLTIDTTKLRAYIQDVKPVGVHVVLEFYVTGPFQFDTGLGYDLGKYAGAL